MTQRTGGCLCGQVRYRLSAEPVVSRLCWCRDCQHIAGNGTANAIFPTDSIQITGTTAEFSSRGDSGCWRRPKTEPLMRVVPTQN